MAEKTEKTVEGKVAENGEAEVPKDGPAVEEAAREEETPAVEAPKAWAKPKQWAGLFSKPGVAPTASNESERGSAPAIGQTNAEILAETLSKFNAESKDTKVAFLEPRGLVNTGNMCYMNSVSMEAKRDQDEANFNRCSKSSSSARHFTTS